MTTPFETAVDETAVDQMAVDQIAEEETAEEETAMDQMAAEPDAGMLERVPFPAEPLPSETFPVETLPVETLPVETLPAENPEFPAADATASLSARWHEIKAMFVDDPRSSAEMAASLVDDSAESLVAFVREQQDSLLAAWHGENAGTEELRTAVQHYRAFSDRLAEFTRES